MELKQEAVVLRKNVPKPDTHIISLFENNNRVIIIDSPGFTGSIDFLKYLIPALYREGIYNLDLWFIPRDGMVQANALLNASRFFTASAAELIGQISYLTLFQEYVDLLEYIYMFNKTLPEGSPLMSLVDEEKVNNSCLILNSDSEDQSDNPHLMIQSPLLFEYLSNEGKDKMVARIKEISYYLSVGDSLYIFESDELSYDLIMLSQPGKLSLCSPYKEGINKENAERALKDFPNISISAPWAAVPLMKRAQRRYLNNLSP